MTSINVAAKASFCLISKRHRAAKVARGLIFTCLRSRNILISLEITLHTTKSKLYPTTRIQTSRQRAGGGGWPQGHDIKSGKWVSSFEVGLLNWRRKKTRAPSFTRNLPGQELPPPWAPGQRLRPHPPRAREGAGKGVRAKSAESQLNRPTKVLLQRPSLKNAKSFWSEKQNKKSSYKGHVE